MYRFVCVGSLLITINSTQTQIKLMIDYVEFYNFRTEQSYDDQGSLTLGQLMPNVIDPPQHDNSLLLRQSSMPSR